MRQAMPIAECLALGGFASAQAGLNTHWRMRHRSNLAAGFLHAGGRCRRTEPSCSLPQPQP
jgi:hypothetical protein